MTSPLISALAAYRQFIVVLFAPGNGKTMKFPARHSNGMVCDAHDPTAWTDYATAAAAAARHGPAYGVGFVLTANDPFFCLDIDGAAVNGQWSPLAQQLCTALPGTVVEVSQSGAGLHLWGRRQPMPEHGKRNTALHIELYSSLRFIALGSIVVGEMAADCPALDTVIAAYFPPKVGTGADVPATGPRADWRGPTDDDELIRRALLSRSDALQAASAFGGNVDRASFADLWTADERVLASAFPPDNANDAYNRSSADAALWQHLAFWTGCDQQRMRDIAERSALKREKWSRGDYVARTISNACSMQREVLQDKPIEPGPALAPAAEGVSPMPGMRAVEGSTFLGPKEQADLFKGCIYVVDQHRVLVPGGQLLKPEAFNAKFGGYTFAMDARNERTSRKAFEALTESQVLRAPKVDSVCFRPRLPYGAIVTDAGRTRANQWWPVEVPRIKGDATPFLKHLALLLPVARDAQITLAYLAACVQEQGVKFQWSIVLQGVPGNGKTLLSKCVARAVGERYVHWPKASKLAAQFNKWLLGNVVYLVEDIHTSEHVDVVEELKPMITGGTGLEIEGKGVDQISAEVCGNFIFNTNHTTGIRKHRNDRRFCWLACAQQEFEDLARDGMDGPYFTRLWDWLEHEGGYAIVADFLWTFPIPDDLNPAKGCQRAPITSSTEAAIRAGLGYVEQEILEAVSQGRPGFKDGWISSIFVTKLVESLPRAKRMSAHDRKEMMRGLGYEKHTVLPDGQTANPVLPDGGKPTLYVTKGHSSLSLRSPGDVARAYTAAQLATY